MRGEPRYRCRSPHQGKHRARHSAGSFFFNRAYLLSLHLLFAAHPAAAAAVLEGRVVTVSEGHSLVVLVDNRRIPVRVAGIDAPTGTARYAIAARQSLIAVCGGEPARVEVREQGKDGAVVGRVSCNGTDAAAEQLRRGMASVDIDADAHLRALQAEARATKRGVWSTREAQVQRVDR